MPARTHAHMHTQGSECRLKMHQLRTACLTQRRAHTHTQAQQCTQMHTHKHIYANTHTCIYAHTHLYATTPICKCRHRHSCLPSAPPAPCPPHAKPPCAELDHANPQPRSPGPQSHANGHAGPGGGGTAPHSAGSSTPLCLAQPLAPVLALTWKTWVLKAPALPSLRISSPLGVNPARGPFPSQHSP